MPVLQIGNTCVPYTVRHSSRVKRLQMVIAPNLVEVVAPVNTSANQITEFLNAKRHWLFNSLEDFKQQVKTAVVQRYVSGAKLLYRGRRLMLSIKPSDISEIIITCKSRFHIQIPLHLVESDREAAVATALENWMRKRALQESRHLVKFYAQELGAVPNQVKLSEQQRFWAICDKNQIIRINWRLIHAPTPAFEYVIAHETTHLIHKNHSRQFWATLGIIMPDWRERKALLEDWESESV
jgi:predicted metal-dependent hydrolase